MKTRLFILCLLLLLPATCFAAFPEGWGRKCLLTLDRAHTPALFTVANLPSEMFDADGTYPALNGGGDIRFSSDVYGTTQLACHIISFTTNNNPALGTAEIRVNSGTSTAIYVWYNKAGETQPAVDADYGQYDTYSLDFIGKWVLKDGTDTSHVTEETWRQRTGTKTGAGNPAEATGVLGKGQTFTTASSSKIDCGDIAGADFGTGDFELSGWVKRAAAGEAQYIVQKDDTTNRQFGLHFNSSNKGAFIYFTSGAAAVYQLTTNTFTSTSAYYYVVGQRIGNGFKIYINGADESLDSLVGTHGTMDATSAVVTMGSRGTAYSNGIIDDVAIYSGYHSANWIADEYESVTSPATFATAGTPEDHTDVVVNLLSLKVVVKDSAALNLDLKARLRNPLTWYIRPSGTTYGNADGTSYADAWAGWVNVNWSSIDLYDTIEDYTGENFTIEGRDFSGGEITINGRATIDGTSTANNANWTNVSGNIYYIGVGSPDIDYDYTTYPAPASPVNGEKWYISYVLKRGTVAGWPTTWDWDYPPLGTGTALEYQNGEWLPCSWHDGPNQLWVDGVRTMQGTVEVTDIPAPTAYYAYLSHASFGGRADNYWAGSTVAFRVTPNQWNTRIIQSSTGNNISYYATMSELTNGYIKGDLTNIKAVLFNIPYQELNTEGDWTYDRTTGRMYVYSSDPTSHTWVYSDGGCNIVLRNCTGIKLSGYAIEKSNNGAILAYKTSDLTIQNCTITDSWTSCGFLNGGAISVIGDDIYDTSNPTLSWLYQNDSQTTGITIQDCNITKSHAGSGIWLDAVGGVIVDNNYLSEIGDQGYPMNIPCAIAGVKASGQYTNNNLYYNYYAGLYLFYIENSLISGNVVNDCMSQMADGGPVLISDGGIAGNLGGNTIEYNRIERNAPGKTLAGVYLDWGASNNTIQNNILYKIWGGETSSNGLLGGIYEDQYWGPTAGTQSTGNCAYNNVMYDDYAPLTIRADTTLTWVYGLSGTPTPGTTTWPNGVPDAYGNVRYAESTYPYGPVDLLDLKLMVTSGFWINGINCTGIGGILAPAGVGGIE